MVSETVQAYDASGSKADPDVLQDQKKRVSTHPHWMVLSQAGRFKVSRKGRKVIVSFLPAFPTRTLPPARGSHEIFSGWFADVLPPFLLCPAFILHK